MYFKNQEVGSVSVRYDPWCPLTRIAESLLWVTGGHKSYFKIAIISGILNVILKVILNTLLGCVFGIVIVARSNRGLSCISL